MRKAKIPRSAPDKPLWIDLGCGNSKQPGYVGIDRFALPGVDIVCDLDMGIPLQSDTVDYLLASHSLEHLRDLPAAIGEIFRVCKDRALITIIAPYEATQLNRANPYHFQAWNEHTPRFFTTDGVSPLDAEEFDFPAITVWGLGASDHSQSQVDLRCLHMQFHYFPAYRSLDERTKRTLRHSMTDVCDQMALHLLVVKSAITQEELSSIASTSKYQVTPAFEARQRDEATSSQNLFSELAQLPERLAAESTKVNQEIGQLGDEIRRSLHRLDQLDRALVAQAEKSKGLTERVDHLDRALVAEIRETRQFLSELVGTGRSLGERLTAVNSALTRRMQENGAELRADLSEKLDATTKLQSAQAAVGDQIVRHLVAERRGRADGTFWPIKYLRRYRQRAVDLRGEMGGEFAALWQGADAQPLGRFKLQRGVFLEASVARSYKLLVATSRLRGIDIGLFVMFPPVSPITIADYELSDPSNGLICTGTLAIDHSCRTAPVRINLENVTCPAEGTLTLKLLPRQSVEQIGIQFFEWHRVSRFLRRVRELRLACRCLYDETSE